MPGVTILDPTLWWKSLRIDIADGPGVRRDRYPFTMKRDFLFILIIAALCGAALEILSHDMPILSTRGGVGFSYFILSFHATTGASKGALVGTAIGLVHWWRCRKPPPEADKEGE